jgi:hypothetical protein
LSMTINILGIQASPSLGGIIASLLYISLSFLWWHNLLYN